MDVQNNVNTEIRCSYYFVHLDILAMGQYLRWLITNAKMCTIIYGQNNINT